MKHIVTVALLIAASLAGCSSKSASSDAIPELEKAANFSADSAYSFIEAQVAMGPRVPGTAAHTACHDWIASTLDAMGAHVQMLDTTIVSPDGKAVAVRNILGAIRPDAPRQVLIAAHYDTRPWADRDPDPAAWHTPIDGANDGASGVAVALELARNATAADPNVGLQILMLDCEDAGSYDGDDREWCLGSQAYAASLSPADKRPHMAILLDMVGGKGATFPREYFSQAYAPETCRKIWSAAARLGLSERFPDRVGGAVNDDHCYLIEGGIPCVDIIESANPSTGSFNPTWHTLQDNLHNIDRATLQDVGDVVTEAIYH